MSGNSAPDLVLTTRAPGAKLPNAPNIAGARQVTDAQAEAIQRNREEIHKKFAVEEEATTSQNWGNGWEETANVLLGTDKDQQSETIEDVESVEIAIPPCVSHTGMVVLFGPPKGMSLTMRVLQMFGTREASAQSVGVMRVLLCIQQIDGADVKPITNLIEATALANRIGDDAIDLLSLTYRQYWRPLQLAQLPVLKKNLRR